ncbi:MAG: PAS domain-containing protein [Chloroflexi bacterium]|nr:PAS domain-containing protein [Chloroflexota bacterium]
MGISNSKNDLNKPSKSAATGRGKKTIGKIAVPQSTTANTENQYNMLQSLIDSANIPIFSVDSDYSYISFNKSHASMMKSIYGVDIQPGNCLLDYMTMQADREKARVNLDRALLKGERVIEEAYLGDESLSRLYFEIFYIPTISPAGEIKGVLVLARDITRRKQAEESILNSKLLLQSVIDATPDFIYVKDFEHRFILVNRSFAKSQNLSPQDMIGRPDTDFFSEELCLGNPGKGVAGFHADDLQAFQGHLVQNPGNIVTWADGSRHIYDTYKIPLTDQSGKIYAAIVFSRDSTERQRVEDSVEATRNASQRTLLSVIDTIAKVVEMHDPHTAGHQQRVAALAAAIAREMKLDDSRIENLIIAAKIHDIGKMYVPTDILSKPGKLTDIELSMIITHAQGSYDILWKAEFPKQVALMVLQHHERLDGSGYPNELKGEQMLTESKILAVADVVEAIVSNRPYRLAFGIDKALEEISNNRGKLYDPEVVDACLKLFNEKGFKFEE